MTIEEVDTASNKGKLVDLTARLVAAYVRNNAVPTGDLSTLLNTVHAALSAAAMGNEETAIASPSPVPAVNPKSRLHPITLFVSKTARSSNR